MKITVQKSTFESALASILKMGFLALSLSSKSSSPIVSSAGMGTYMFMPIGESPVNPAPATALQPEPKTEVISNSPTNPTRPNP